MPKIVKRRIWWDPVNVDDLVGYRVYYAPAQTPFDYSLPYIIKERITDGCEAVAPDDFPVGVFNQEAQYSIWVTAVDEVGNESDPLALSGRFDFIPPPAPSNGGIETL